MPSPRTTAAPRTRDAWCCSRPARALADALRHLDQNPGASLHDLALLTFQTDQSFGALAARLESRGLVERVPGPGRAARHRLTQKGAELRRAGAEVMDQVLAESFRSLSAGELKSFDRLLRTLLTS